MLFCEIYKIFKVTLFYRRPPVTASFYDVWCPQNGHTLVKSLAELFFQLSFSRKIIESLLYKQPFDKLFFKVNDKEIRKRP